MPPGSDSALAPPVPSRHSGRLAAASDYASDIPTHSQANYGVSVGPNVMKQRRKCRDFARQFARDMAEGDRGRVRSRLPRSS